MFFHDSDNRPRMRTNKRIGTPTFVNSWFYSWMVHYRGYIAYYERVNEVTVT